MNNSPYSDTSDDLPRTLRRERESRERAAREMQARAEASTPAAPARGGWERSQASVPATQPSIYGTPEPVNPGYGEGYTPPGETSGAVTVRRLKVPFFSLMAFFIKAVFAAIPAILILVAMLWGLGVALQTYFPQLIKMKILISFP